MRKAHYVNQPFGLGDILFLYPAIQYMSRTRFDGEMEFIWPVEPEFEWIKSYLPGFDGRQSFPLHIISKKYTPETFTRFGQHNYSEFTRLEFRYSDHVNSADTMRSKYSMYGVPISEWTTLAWKRNSLREEALADVLGVDLEKPFAYVNRHYANPSLNWQSDFTPNIECDTIVEGRYVEGFTLLDWALIWEYATEIHTVSTSNFYPISVLDTQGTCYLYPRTPTEKTLDPIRSIIPEKWIQHG